jgi:peptidoglycan/LPS O-acetylase OafA/YrhL
LEKIAATPPFQRLTLSISRSTIPGLNGIRVVATLLVVLDHYVLQRGEIGNLGVEIFFVLSGFLITTLLLRELAKTGTVSLRGFYRRRARRILPAFYVFWVVAVAVEVYHKHPLSTGQLAATLFYFNNYYHGAPFIGHAWSLAVEEQFYLLWPVLFLVFRNDLKRFARVVFGLAIGCEMWRTAVMLAGTKHYFGGKTHDFFSHVYVSFECRADQLFWGCLLAIVLNRKWFPRFFSALCASPWLMAPTSVALLASAGPRTSWLTQAWRGMLVEGLLSAVLLVQAMGLAEGTRPWHWLNSTAAAFGARISYSFYLYHMVPLSFRTLEQLGKVPSVVLAFAISMGLASLSYFVVERRFLKPRGLVEPEAAAAAAG